MFNRLTIKTLMQALLRACFVVLFVVVAAVGVGANFAQAAAGTPAIVNYQARLTNASGTAITAATNMRFVIWDSLSGGSCVWSGWGTGANGCTAPNASQVSVTPVNGVFSVPLGDTTYNSQNALQSNIFNDDSRYLEIQIYNGSSYETLSPRKRILSAPYAFNSSLLAGLSTSAAGGSSAFVPVTDSSGKLTLTAGVTFSGAGISLNDNSNFNTTVNTGSSTGTITLGNTANGGAVGILSHAAITMTAGAASTWSTSAGALTLDSAAALNLGTASATSISLGQTGITTTSNGALTVTQTLTGNGNITFSSGNITGATPLSFDGATADAYKTIFAITDPTGSSKTITFPNASGTVVVSASAPLSIDTLGNITCATCVTSTATLQSAYNAGQTITTSSSHDIAFTLTSGNFTASGGGSVNLTPTGASSFTSSGALTFTAGAASTWKTSAGTLTIQSGDTTASALTINTLGAAATGAITVTSGISTAGASGALNLNTGNATAGASGAIAIASGTTTTSGTTGNITINSGAPVTTSLNSGSISIISGNVGATGTSGAVSLDVGTGGTAGAINIGTSTIAKTITIGSTTTTIQTIGIGNGTAGSAITIGNGVNTVAQQIQIGNGASGANSEVDILSGVGTAGAGTVKIGDNTRATVLDFGNIAPAAARTISIGSTGAQTPGAVDTINIGTAAGTVAGAETIHIGDGTPTGSGTNLVTIGSLAALANTTTIQGGNGATAINLNTAASGQINIANNAVAHTISIGSGAGANVQTITIGANAAASTIAIGSSSAGASSYISGGALTLTGGAASTWGTSAGNLSLQAAGTSAIGNIQIGVGGTGSTTPDYLVLDATSSGFGTGDPTGGANGAMYYNIGLNKFRCYENGAWANCIGSSSGARLDQVSGATTTATIANANNAITWNWGTLTTQTGLTLGGGSAMTTGENIQIGPSTYVHTTAQTGQAMDVQFTDASTLTTDTSITNGLHVGTTINTSGAGLKSINAFSANAPTLTGCASGACTWNGFNVNTQATGAAATITQNGLNISAVGIAAGVLNGINITNITAGAGTEYAIKIGTGWDRGIKGVGALTIDAAGALSVGATDATSVSIGSSGITTTNNGPLTATGLLTGNLGLTVVNNSSANIATFSSNQSWPGYTVSGGTTTDGINGLELVNSGAYQYNVGLGGPTNASIANTFFIYNNNTGNFPFEISPTGGFSLNTASTTGTMISATNKGGTTQGAGALTGMLLDLNTNLTVPAAGQNTTALELRLPAATTTSNAAVYTGLNLSTAGAISNSTAGSIAWNGAAITMPNMTQGSGGSVTSSGIKVTSGTITTGGTQNGINVVAAGVGAGTLNGINVGTITGGAGTENAINIGGGWDNSIYVNGGVFRINSSGQVFSGGTLSYIPAVPLNLINSAASAVKSQISLINTGGGSGAGSAIDYYTYDVSGGTNPGIRLAGVDDGNYSGNFIIYTKTPGAAGNALVERFRVLSGGNVTITGTGATCTLGGGTGATSCTSDARLKTNVVNLSDSTLASVMALRPVDFNWNNLSTYDQSVTHIGLIAQEVKTNFPDAVHVVYTDPKLGDIYGVDYAYLVVPAIKAIQQQQALLGSFTMTTDDLSKLVANIQSEAPHDPIAIINDKINGGVSFLVDFVAARVTAVHGYFDEVFMNKSHQKVLCVGDAANGGETCITKTQLDQLLSNQNQSNLNAPSAPPAPAVVSPAPTPVVTVPSTDTTTPPPTTTNDQGPTTNTPVITTPTMTNDQVSTTNPPTETTPATATTNPPTVTNAATATDPAATTSATTDTATAPVTTATTTTGN
jgi:hypothetical protein